MIEFEQCDVSGQLFCNAKRGQYWIDGGAWSGLCIVSVDKAGPNIKKLGVFNTADDAKKYADDYDNGEISNDW